MEVGVFVKDYTCNVISVIVHNIFSKLTDFTVNSSVWDMRTNGQISIRKVTMVFSSRIKLT